MGAELVDCGRKIWGVPVDARVGMLVFPDQWSGWSGRLVLWSGLLSGLSREAANAALLMVRAYRAGIEAGMKAEKREQGSNHEMLVRAYRAGYEVAQQL